MDFYEVEGKRLFDRFGIPTDNGVLYADESSLDEVTFPCVVKAQTLSGKRGKAGGVRFVDSPKQLAETVKAVSEVIVKGKKTAGVYIVPKMDIAKEHYIGITLDRKERRILVIYSPAGGMDIEELAASQPDKLIKFPVLTELDRDGFARCIKKFALEAAIEEQLTDIAAKLFNMYVQLDATTIEINPLAQLKNGKLTAADAKLVIDDNALYRQGDYTLIPRTVEESEREREAREHNLAYVEIEKRGGLGVIAGGAGIGMATVDTIKFYNGVPFNFMDLGGGVTSEKTCAAVTLLLKNPDVQGIVINVFGGINNCHDMALGIEKAVNDTKIKKPIVVKSRGFNQEQGWAIYDRMGIGQVRYGTTDDAVKLLLKMTEVAK